MTVGRYDFFITVVCGVDAENLQEARWEIWKQWRELIKKPDLLLSIVADDFGRGI